MYVIITLILLYTLLFALYLELNPRLTNIWYRTGADGKKHIYPSNYVNFMFKPFTTRELWYLHLLDCNYWFGLSIVICFYIFYCRN